MTIFLLSGIFKNWQIGVFLALAGTGLIFNYKASINSKEKWQAWIGLMMLITFLIVLIKIPIGQSSLPSLMQLFLAFVVLGCFFIENKFKINFVHFGCIFLVIFSACLPVYLDPNLQLGLLASAFFLSLFLLQITQAASSADNINGYYVVANLNLSRRFMLSFFYGIIILLLSWPLFLITPKFAINLNLPRAGASMVDFKPLKDSELRFAIPAISTGSKTLGNRFPLYFQKLFLPGKEEKAINSYFSRWWPKKSIIKKRENIEPLKGIKGLEDVFGEDKRKSLEKGKIGKEKAGLEEDLFALNKEKYKLLKDKEAQEVLFAQNQRLYKMWEFLSKTEPSYQQKAEEVLKKIAADRNRLEYLEKQIKDTEKKINEKKRFKENKNLFFSELMKKKEKPILPEKEKTFAEEKRKPGETAQIVKKAKQEKGRVKEIQKIEGKAGEKEEIKGETEAEEEAKGKGKKVEQKDSEIKTRHETLGAPKEKEKIETDQKIEKEDELVLAQKNKAGDIEGKEKNLGIKTEAIGQEGVMEGEKSLGEFGKDKLREMSENIKEENGVKTEDNQGMQTGPEESKDKMNEGGEKKDLAGEEFPRKEGNQEKKQEQRQAAEKEAERQKETSEENKSEVPEQKETEVATGQGQGKEGKIVEEQSQKKSKEKQQGESRTANDNISRDKAIGKEREKIESKKIKEKTDKEELEKVQKAQITSKDMQPAAVTEAKTKDETSKKNKNEEKAEKQKESSSLSLPQARKVKMFEEKLPEDSSPKSLGVSSPPKEKTVSFVPLVFSGKKRQNTLFYLWAIIAIMAIGIIVIGYAVVVRIIKEMHLRHLAVANPKLFIMLVYKNLRIVFLRLKIKTSSWMTPKEVVFQITDAFYWAKDDFSKITDLFIMARYSQHNLSKEEAQISMASYAKLKNRILQNAGVATKVYLKLKMFNFSQ